MRGGRPIAFHILLSAFATPLCMQSANSSIQSLPFFASLYHILYVMCRTVPYCAVNIRHCAYANQRKITSRPDRADHSRLFKRRYFPRELRPATLTAHPNHNFSSNQYPADLCDAVHSPSSPLCRPRVCHRRLQPCGWRMHWCIFSLCWAPTKSLLWSRCGLLQCRFPWVSAAQLWITYESA